MIFFVFLGAASQDVKQTIEYVEERDKTEYLIRYLNSVQDGIYKFDVN